MHRLVLITALVAATTGALATDAGAQATRGNGGRTRQEPTVPAAYQPPPGMCRIWLEGVPPGQQPAPTDCATAVRNRPANGRVLFGDDADRNRKGSRRAERDEGGDGRGTVAAGGEGRADDRYGRPFRRGSDVCADLNRDGVCDDAEGAGGQCIDRDRDGVCDDMDASGGGRALPLMSAATQYARGERPADVVRWIGGQSLTARASEMGRNGAPTRVVWLNDVGDVVQIWLDRDRDGRADRIEIYKDGRRIQSFGQY